MAFATYEPPWLRTVDLDDEVRALRVWWRQPQRVRRAIQAYRDLLAGTPACIAYAFTLFITWWTLRGASDIVGRRLIFSASTNLRNMQKDPIQVLVASAFWTDGGFPWGDILILITLMALAERWLGSLRWILVVATGHVGATLITVLGIAHKIDRHLIPTRVAFASDVGPSYGISAMLAALTFRLRGPARWLWALCVLVWYAYGVWHGRTFTDYGHFFALLIGFTVGAIAVALSHRLVAVRDRKARKSTGHRVGPPPVALHEPDGGLDDARRDRAEHGHH
ncbi:rhomboid-like protein [Nocardia sp. CDC160]|uniref:rhomboid-like protein n=1 Tax=Nocardia sp. CDC160 TaxID=3112166 RepID=UPI002DB9AF89|nr:rhomboid-like protein [Nocardia sp. CDC160]MEC3914509.1 rhomboid-like protein [Nocardia sp. CDC160]